MAVVQTIVVDMSTRGANPVAYTHQNDEWRTFLFEMYNNGEAVDMTGWSCKVGAILPSNDGGYRVIAGNQMDVASINENVVSATLGPPYTSKAGNGVLTLIFTTDTGHTIRPINIDFRIQESADGEDVVAGASDFVPVLEQYMNENMETYINGWLDDHPEATTTVQDGSITYPKLVTGTLGFVTPEMFGAVGDGTTDDTTAWQNTLNFGGAILCNASKNYLISSALRVKAGTSIDLNGCTVTCNQKRWLLNFLDADEFTGYNGNGNIVVKNGTVIGGSVSFWHCKNVVFDNVHFKNCINDHFFELCAAKDFTIKYCSFVGMMQRESSVHEYINIDPNTTTQSTYFTGTSYPAANYDGTKCENVLILENYFNINENDEDFQAQDNPFGCHSPLGNYHKNIQFIENTCLNFKKKAFRLSDFEESIIKGNYFRSELCTETAIQMSKSNDMTYSNINCLIEDNTLITMKWGASFQDAKGLTVRRNSYENLDYYNHSFGTLAAGNVDFSFYDNVKNKNSTSEYLSIDSGDYTSITIPPFDILQRTKVSPGGITISGATATLKKLRWTFFDRIYIQFTSSPKIYEVDAWQGNVFQANNNYPVIQDQTTGANLVYITIDGNDPSVLTVNFATGVTSQTVQTVYVEKTIGTMPST